MMHTFKAVGLSYKRTPLAIREQLALDEAACGRILHQLSQDMGLADVLVLSTCNRTEVYYRAPQDHGTAIITALEQECGVEAGCHQLYFDRYTAPQAATTHLLEVALGLDAQVMGDGQIGNQVKRAYQRSADAQAAGPFMHRLLHTVFAAGKRVQQETAFRDGAASTSSATLALVEELTANLARPRVLIVGLGEMGADICRHFGKSRLFTEVTICNRTRATAEVLAAECDLRVLDFAQVAHGVQHADVIISAIAAPTPFFTHELVAGLDILSPKFFIDLAVPRSVAATAENVPGVLVYDIDTIQVSAARARAGRAMQVSPTIQKLKNTLEQLRQEEMRRFQKTSTPAEVRLLDEVTKSLTQKFLKLPVLQLKAACQRGEADELVAMLTDLFALEREVA